MAGEEFEFDDFEPESQIDERDHDRYEELLEDSERDFDVIFDRYDAMQFNSSPDKST